jgi:hypothetical protein
MVRGCHLADEHREAAGRVRRHVAGSEPHLHLPLDLQHPGERRHQPAEPRPGRHDRRPTRYTRSAVLTTTQSLVAHLGDADFGHELGT